MHTTGIVRRIDELGRVVIPKELRRTMKIREGEELEIFADDNNMLVLKKFSVVKNMKEFAQEYAQAVNATTGHTVLVADKDIYVSAVGTLSKDFKFKEISHSIESVIMSRRKEIRDSSNYYKLTIDDAIAYKGQIVQPIMSGGDVFGAIIMVSSTTAISEADNRLLDTAKTFLEYQL